jgi:hypothetical protein
MPFRFRKRIRTCKGIPVNLSNSGTSLSVGGKGVTTNFPRREPVPPCSSLEPAFLTGPGAPQTHAAGQIRRVRQGVPISPMPALRSAPARQRAAFSSFDLKSARGTGGYQPTVSIYNVTLKGCATRAKGGSTPADQVNRLRSRDDQSQLPGSKAQWLLHSPVIGTAPAGGKGQAFYAERVQVARGGRLGAAPKDHDSADQRSTWLFN